MRTSLPFLLLSTAAVVSAVSSGQVFYVDTPVSPISHSTDTVNPKTARLILAQRLGLSDYYDVDHSEIEELHQIDAFGGPGSQLFQAPSKAEGSKVVIVVDGVERVEVDSRFSSFDISPAPHPEDNEQLLATFAGQAQAEGRRQTKTIYHNYASIDTEVVRAVDELSNVEGNHLDSYGHRTMLHVTSIANAAKEYGSNSREHRHQLEILRYAIDRLHAISKDGGLSMAIVFSPVEHRCSKRSANVYGFDKLSRRQTRISEAPLTAPVVEAVATKQKTARPQTSTSRPNTLAKGQPIPLRYTSKDACERTTANCTGHGSCVSLYKEPTLKLEFFGCKCKADVQDVKGGGTKTTTYGGPACQKKSVVAPFWLLASVSVLLVTIISLALGLLYSMGAEELPSVIGAGVSGPKPR